jgi:hypothetical protein
MQRQWFFKNWAGRQQFLVGSRKFGFSDRAVALACIYLPYKFVGGTLTSPIEHQHLYLVKKKYINSKKL